jgi:hypothetical protein
MFSALQIAPWPWGWEDPMRQHALPIQSWLFSGVEKGTEEISTGEKEGQSLKLMNVSGVHCLTENRQNLHSWYIQTPFCLLA